MQLTEEAIFSKRQMGLMFFLSRKLVAKGKDKFFTSGLFPQEQELLTSLGVRFAKSDNGWFIEMGGFFSGKQN